MVYVGGGCEMAFASAEGFLAKFIQVLWAIETPLNKLKSFGISEPKTCFSRLKLNSVQLDMK